MEEGRAGIALHQRTVARSVASPFDAVERGTRMSTSDHTQPHSAAEDTIALRLSGGAEAAAVARRHLSRLRGDLDPPLMETMRLLVTELVANSVKHAAANSVELKVVVGRSAVWVEVVDEGPGFEPRPRTKDSRVDSGWGLFLVERLANRWGVVREGDTTRVWFELLRVV
jgi:anti-sigma regulatory factor (Ser/Thr protein kinase)